jgi:hypothetical protein
VSVPSLPQRLLRPLLVWMAGASLLLSSGCGFDAQTMQPYSPAMGVSANTGADGGIHIRNLLLVSREDGQAFVSASLLADRSAALTGVSGMVFDRNHAPGVPLTSNLREPLRLVRGEWAILAERPAVRVTSPILRPATNVLLQLRFADAGSVELWVPVYRDQNEYEAVTPIPRSGDVDHG